MILFIKGEPLGGKGLNMKVSLGELKNIYPNTPSSVCIRLCKHVAFIFYFFYKVRIRNFVYVESTTVFA